MSGWEWLIGISVLVAAIAFVVLVVYLVLALQSMRCTLKNTDVVLRESQEILGDLEEKIHSFDPYFKVVSGVGNRVERYAERENNRIERASSTAAEVLDWALIGVTLFDKVRERWR